MQQFFRRRALLAAMVPVTVPMVALLSGCELVPKANPISDRLAKEFQPPADRAQVYVFRNETIGHLLPMPLAVDGKQVAQTLGKSFIVLQLKPGTYEFSSRADNSHAISFSVEAGRNYYVWQQVLVSNLQMTSKLRLVDEITGRTGVLECELIELAQAAP